MKWWQQVFSSFVWCHITVNKNILSILLSKTFPSFLILQLNTEGVNNIAVSVHVCVCLCMCVCVSVHVCVGGGGMDVSMGGLFSCN